MTAADAAVIDEYYEWFKETLVDTPSKDIILVIGNLNVKVGVLNSHEEVIGNMVWVYKMREEGI